MKKNIKVTLVFILCIGVLCSCGRGQMSIIANSEGGDNQGLDAQTSYEQTTDIQSSYDKMTETEQAQSAYDSTTGEAVIYVFVCGAVQNEGVYELPVNARADAALKAAGGFSENADTSAVNLAGTLTDGQQLYFPEIGEAIDGDSVVSQNGSANNLDADSQGDERINLNTATKEQLTSLSGIGDVKAENIIAYRDKNGSFQNTEDIMNVDGIGQALYDKIKDKIYVE
jgi:competence protein ComEA